MRPAFKASAKALCPHRPVPARGQPLGPMLREEQPSPAAGLDTSSCSPLTLTSAAPHDFTDSEPQDPSPHAGGDGWRHREEAGAERAGQRVSVSRAGRPRLPLPEPSREVGRGGLSRPCRAVLVLGLLQAVGTLAHLHADLRSGQPLPSTGAGQGGLGWGPGRLPAGAQPPHPAQSPGTWSTSCLALGLLLMFRLAAAEARCGSSDRPRRPVSRPRSGRAWLRAAGGVSKRALGPPRHRCEAGLMRWGPESSGGRADLGVGSSQRSLQ